MVNKKTRLLILRNEDPYDHEPWIEACKYYKDKVDFDVVDITMNNWIDEIISYNPDVCLLKPSGKTSKFRTLYQERIEVLVKDLELKIFPSYDEIRIYENKRYFAYWVKSNNIPHPKTFIFYHKNEALEFIKTISYPIVGKINIGASGNGVQILRDYNELNNYIKKAFGEGLGLRTGPKLNKGNLIKRILDKLANPDRLLNKLKTYNNISKDKQIGFLILQKFIPHTYEWRVVRIGDSFFAHKKLVTKEKASGTLLKGYENPPLRLFDFVKELTDRFKFRSVAVDLFEPEQNRYLVNEIQCIFGQSDPYQMLVNGIPGRYRHIDGNWIFEDGDFNSNQSYNLRLKNVLASL
jgi:glutathione synthase/RimK-type ligase-like ATP-grasp enzyme